MNRTILPLVGLAAFGLPLALPAVASAQSTGGDVNYQATLDPVATNMVNGSGTATVTLSGNEATISVTANQLLDSAPHAQHIHIAGSGECPKADAAHDHNGHKAISTADGLPAYGKIGTSLTTTGDTSPNSALAVDRFPSTGAFHYTRTITVTPDVAQQIRANNAVIVVHGIDYNHNGKYDNVLGASELDAKLPQEATAPAICGALKAMPVGGAGTGDGATQATGSPNTADLLATGLGGAAVAALAGTLLLRRRAASKQ
ncbi:hypothetical protein QMK19_08675 [Streptomyces sp. H10-C2]|uniref:hypothetical protein n=1 Tax=unclassified Streptomyces TaxID=2593676 RepID=UPI0024B8A44D|nr:MULTISPECIES: hypothetical protein [unclassified Streptomyces]MDJ0341018.1 hypothetical protein [Streptomyces sp. PH10-H1]MDJ0369750.1 hypothetical protein [Streptomyces sp. H10-C2]